MLRALGLAYYWQSLIEAGRFESFSAIAAAEGISKGHVSRLMQLLRLLPERVQEVLKAPRAAGFEKLTRQEVPMCWERQAVEGTLVERADPKADTLKFQGLVETGGGHHHAFGRFTRSNPARPCGVDSRRLQAIRLSMARNNSDFISHCLDVTGNKPASGSLTDRPPPAR